MSNSSSIENVSDSDARIKGDELRNRVSGVRYGKIRS